MSRIDLTWLSKLNVGDSVIFAHSIINPKGRRHRVVAANKRWLTLDNKVRVSLVTGDVIQMRDGPQCESVYPWKEPVVSAEDTTKIDKAGVQGDLQYADAFEGKPVLTVPREGKWYTLMVLCGPEGKGPTLEVSFGYLHDHCGIESPYRDHVPNPAAVAKLCQANGFVMGPQAWIEMQARWADTEA